MKNMQVHTVKNIEFFVFIALFFLLSAATYSRNLKWLDESLLWADALDKSPLKARPHNSMGRIYLKKGAYGLSLKEFLKAVSIKPEFAPAHSNLAHIYYLQGRLDEAERELGLAMAYGPPYEDLHRRLGFVYLRKGLRSKALDEFARAMKLVPTDPDVIREVKFSYNNEAFSYTDDSDFNSALLLHRLALSLDPEYANAHYGMALASEGLGRLEEAAFHWREFLRLAPRDNRWRVLAQEHLERLQRRIKGE